MSIAAVWLQPWDAVGDGIFPGGGDLAWVQATAEMHSRVGPLGTEPHLSWPSGLGTWSVPQLGMLFALVSWFAGGVLGLPSALTVWIMIILTAGLCSASTLYFLRSLVGESFPALTVTSAICLGVSPFVIGKADHLNVANFFILPLTLGSVVNWLRLGRRPDRWLGVSGLFVGGLLSPLWWMVVAVVFVMTSALPALVRRSWVHLQAWGVAFAALMVPLSIQTLIYTSQRVEGAAGTRGPWESNFWGGHLTDFFVASPALKAAWPRLESLVEGSSPELSPVGLVPGVCALVAVVLVLVGTPRRAFAGVDTTVLADTTPAALLLFLLGGLGNLQAGLAVLLGGGSPARVWARLSILLALLGAAWLLTLFAMWTRSGGGFGRRVHPAALAWSVVLVAAATAAMDVAATTKVEPEPEESFPEFAAVRFIVSNSDPCPVAQLPQDGFPWPRVENQSDQDLADYMYRGFLPYAMAPEYSWSFGSWLPERYDAMHAIGLEVDRTDLRTLREAGFCAVLFDTRLGEKALEDDILLEGRSVRGATADFDRGRFHVYLLGGADNSS